MNIVVVGAHPDDCECYAGGVSVKWARQEGRVLFVSMTNGDIGHYAMSGGVLAQRRAAESRASAKRAGVQELILGYHDGELQATLDVRKEVVRIIRRFNADLVLTHRPNDYHPDHRYTSIAVQDAAFMVTVPHFCPEMPRLERNPVFMYLADAFQKPTPFQPDVAVDISDVIETKLAMLGDMESQMYEWLPWLDGKLDEVPSGAVERMAWLRKDWAPVFKMLTDAGRPALKAWYGLRRARQIRYAEAFEICEYGHQPTKTELAQLFPFFPTKGRR